MEIEHAKQNKNSDLEQKCLSWATMFTFLENPVNAVINLVNNIPVMNSVWRERRELEQMIAAHIHDVGLNSAQVQQECSRGYFDIPAERRIHSSTLRLTGKKVRHKRSNSVPTVP